MVTLCHAMNDMEVLYIRAMLQSAEIPFHIVGENFGSLYPGMQIASYNERRFLVPQEFYESALDLIQELRAKEPDVQDKSEQDLTLGSKIRIVLEAILFGWSSLGGKKKTINKFKNENVSVADSDADKTRRPF